MANKARRKQGRRRQNEDYGRGSREDYSREQGRRHEDREREYRADYGRDSSEERGGSGRFEGQRGGIQEYPSQSRERRPNFSEEYQAPPSQGSGEPEYGSMQGYRGQGFAEQGEQSGSYGSSGYGAGGYYEDSFASRATQGGRRYESGGQQARGRGFRGRGPKGYQRSDERLTEDINDRLTDDDDLDAENVEVKVEKGEVTLTGTVCSRDEKRLAEDLAEDVSGVKHVQNNLRVERQKQGDDWQSREGSQAQREESQRQGTQERSSHRSRKSGN